MTRTATRIPALALAALMALSPVLSGCAGNPASMVTNLTKADPTAPYIGRSKQEIVACAGQPYSRYATGKGENLIYHYSGAGPVPGGGSVKKDKKKDQSPFSMTKSSSGNWDCAATFGFEGDRLARITYAPRQVESKYTEDGRLKKNLPSCSFTLPNCPAR